MIKPILKLMINLFAGFSLFAVPLIVSSFLSDRGIFGEAFVVEFLGATLISSFAILFLAVSLNRFIDEIQPSSYASKN